MNPANTNAEDNETTSDQPTDSLTPHHVEPRSQKIPSWFSQDMPKKDSHLPEIVQPEQENVATHFRPQINEEHFPNETPGQDAYAAYRRSVDMRVREAQQLFDVPPAQRRPTLPAQEIMGRRKLYKLEQREQIFKARRNAKAKSPWLRVASFGIVAAFIGGTAGWGFANSDRILAILQHQLKSVQGSVAALSQTIDPVKPRITETIIQKKAVSIATLDVNDVRGTLNSMIPLMLNAQAAEGAEPVELTISGLPRTAYLTAGIKNAEGHWTLKPSDISGVQLVVPQSDVKQFDIEVAAIEEKSGNLAAPVKAINVQLEGVNTAAVNPPATLTGEGKADVALLDPPLTVSPANSPPSTAVIQINAPSKIPAAQNEAADFVVKGNALLKSGDIASARQFFMRASELGNARGTFGVAQTFDPKIYAALNVVGLKPDAVQSAQWYQKAAQSGIVAPQQ